MNSNDEWVTSTAILDGLRAEEGTEAWSLFVERFRVPIVAFAGSFGLSAADSEDVAQETLLAFSGALRRGRYDRGKGKLSRWLFGIAYRQVLARRRACARAEVTLEADEGGLWDDLPDDHPSTVAWDREWEQMILSRCLERIEDEVEPVTMRAFELQVREGKSAAETADELGVPVKAVYNAKHRVLKRIRELREVLEKTH